MSMIIDAALDAALDYVQSNVEKVYLCSTEPTTHTQAQTTYACANVAVVTGDFVKADGDASGRKLTFSGKAGGAGTAGADGIFLAFCDDTGTALLAVTPCTLQAVTDGATVDFNTYDVVEIADPA